jgi:hypothetical protein
VPLNRLYTNNRSWRLQRQQKTMRSHLFFCFCLSGLFRSRFNYETNCQFSEKKVTEFLRTFLSLLIDLIKLYIQRLYYMNITPTILLINSDEKQIIWVHCGKVHNTFLENDYFFITAWKLEGHTCSLPSSPWFLASRILRPWCSEMSVDFQRTLSLSLPFLMLPLWSTGHPWNALFYFSFLILRQSVGLLGWVIRPSQGRYLYKYRINTNIHALSGIRTYEPSVRVVEDSFWQATWVYIPE